MDFKKVFTLGLISGLFAFVICVVYTQAYYSILVDFSEGAEVSIMLSYCTGGTMAGCFLYFAIRKIIKNAAIANFIFNMIVSAIPLTLVFMVLAQNDIEFSRLVGSVTRINSLIDRYRNGNLRVLMLNASHYGTGLNLENTTHLVFYHKMVDELEKQVIGRAQRSGRTKPLNVHYLCYDNELCVE